MKYLFDTNCIIAIMKRHPLVVARLRQHEVKDFGLPSIAVHELCCSGFRCQRVRENLTRLDKLPFETVEFDRHDAHNSGETAAALMKTGKPFGPMEMQIAGQAMARSLTLLTHNTWEFARVTGLRLEDWEI